MLTTATTGVFPEENIVVLTGHEQVIQDLFWLRDLASQETGVGYYLSPLEALKAMPLDDLYIIRAWFRNIVFPTQPTY